ncbi:MAG: tyrosine-protein phosphatase [Anaerolineales bacterium]
MSTTSGDHPRVVPLEGGYNFRDLGGYATRDGRQTRYGLLFRAGSLGQLTENDQTTLADLGIRTVLDLREADEHAHEGHSQPGPHADLLNMPTTLGREAIRAKIMSNPAGFRMADAYVDSLAPRQAFHAEVFRAMLARLEAPLVFHCSAGKDRTGIIAALLLRLADVPDEDIIADYAATAAHLQDYITRQRERFIGFGMPDFVADELLACAPQTMTQFLTALDERYGGAGHYLLGGGITPDEIERFRARFVG